MKTPAFELIEGDVTKDNNIGNISDTNTERPKVKSVEKRLYCI